MVAGGGGGGGTSGGGGGGVIYQTGVTLPASPRNVVVGAGGNAQESPGIIQHLQAHQVMILHLIHSLP